MPLGIYFLIKFGFYWTIAGWLLGGLLTGTLIDKMFLDARFRRLEKLEEDRNSPVPPVIQGP